MSVNETLARSILKPLDDIEPQTWSAFHLDVYEASRSFILEPKTLGKALKIKTNAVKLLHKKLANNPRILRDVVSIGNRGDPYGDYEEHYALTRGILEALSDYRFPVHLITSSDAILRDLDLLKKIAEESFLHLSIPIVLNHQLYERFYPKESFERTLFLISCLRQALPGVHISAKVFPLLPCLGDDKESLEKMIKALKKVGVNTIYMGLCEALTAKQIQVFLDTLQDCPEIVERFVTRFALEVEDGFLDEGCVEIKPKERESFHHQKELLLDKYQCKSSVPRYIPKDFRYSNYLLAQRLFYRAYHYESIGQESESIKEIAREIQAMRDTVSKKALIDFSKNQKVKRDIDYFLFNKELKSFGQARLFE